VSNGEPQLDERMRRLFAGVDTSLDFSGRLMQRVAALGRAPVADLRAQFERRRALARRRFRREAWSNAATIAGIGAAAGIFVWRHAPAIKQWAQSGAIAEIDSLLVAGVIVALLAGSLWPLLRKSENR
jgi:hypothetical protein